MSTPNDAPPPGSTDAPLSPDGGDVTSIRADLPPSTPGTGLNTAVRSDLPPSDDAGAKDSTDTAIRTDLPPMSVAERQKHEVTDAKKKALSGTVWTVLCFGGGQVVRLAANIILSRLLFEEAFGVMALVYAFSTAIHLFSDVGIHTSIIQNKRGEDRDFLNTAWTLQILRGFSLFLISCLVAWPVSRLYEEPLAHDWLPWLIPLVGFTELIEGFDSTSLALLKRRLLQGRLMTLELFINIVAAAVMIIWAWLTRDNPTIWPLASSVVVSSVIRFIASHFILKGNTCRLCWDRSAVRELFHFGKWVYISTAFTFLANQSDRLVVGYKSLKLLGVYYFAVQLSQVPAMLMNQLASQLVFPLHSRLHQMGQDLKHEFSRVHLATGGFAALLLAGLIATGNSVVEAMYDHRYQGAGWMLTLLTVGVWFQVLQGLENAVLWALGFARGPAMSNAAKVVAMIVLVPVGLYATPTLVSLSGGWLTLTEEEAPLLGMIVAFVASDFVRYITTAYLVRREGLSVFRYDLALTIFMAATGLIALYLSHWLWPVRMKPEVVAGFALTPASAGQGPFPANFPWTTWALTYKKDWTLLILRLVTESVVVVGIWLVAAGACWKAGLVRLPRRGG